MAEKATARVTIAGEAGILAAYRVRVNALLDEEYAGTYRELHTPGCLEYDVKASRGVPFPPFVTASTEFPQLAIQVSWTNLARGERGAATIQAGRLTEQARRDGAPGDELAVDVRAAPDATIELAFACRARRPDGWIGYALTATQHAFFTVRREGDAQVLLASDGVAPEWAERWRIVGEHADYTELDPREPIEPALLEELDRLAHDFAEDWIWFAAAPEEETAIERHRYELYGLTTNEANLRAERLRTAMKRTDDGYAFESAGDAGRVVAALLRRRWLPTERH